MKKKRNGKVKGVDLMGTVHDLRMKDHIIFVKS